MSTQTPHKPARLNLRIAAGDDELIRSAAEATGRSVTEYVTRAAIERALHDVADRRHFALDDEQWDRFIAALDVPPRFNQRLANLLTQPPLDEDVGG